MLDQRINPRHPSAVKIQTEVKKRQAGYRGELKLDYYLGYLPNDYVVLHDVTLIIEKKNVQFDAIIVSARAIFIVEVKNYRGTIIFDPQLRQCFRENGETADGFDYPFTQVENARILLEKWLKNHQLSGLPIYPLISFAHAETIIKVNGNRDATLDHVTYVTSVPTKMMHVHDSLQKENKKLQSDIAHAILTACTEFDLDVIAYFNITPADIQTGVQCPECQVFAMMWERRSWHCPACFHRSQTAHHLALKEFQILFQRNITNRECRNYLHVQSRHTARRLLRNANYQIESPKSYSWTKL